MESFANEKHRDNTKNYFIKINNVTKSYSEGETKRNVLKGINLSVKEGEIIVILGRSGSGKSTILNLLGGMDTPDEGSITIGNASVDSMQEKERTIYRRGNLGFIFQFFNLIPTLTVKENLLLPLELNGQLSAKSSSEVKALLEKVEMADRMDSYPEKLSGGEQQRIAIARALIHDPMLILADEPTGNLDAHTSKMVMDLLYNLTKEKNKTLIMATHSKEIAMMADRVFTLYDGRLFSEKREAFS